MRRMSKIATLVVAAGILVGLNPAAASALTQAPASTKIVASFPKSSTVSSPAGNKLPPAPWYHNGKKWDASTTACASGVATIGAYRTYVRHAGGYLLGATTYFGVCR